VLGKLTNCFEHVALVNGIPCIGFQHVFNSCISLFCRALAEKEMWEAYIKSLYSEHSKDKKEHVSSILKAFSIMPNSLSSVFSFLHIT
jgi:hypothetical protein